MKIEFLQLVSCHRNSILVYNGHADQVTYHLIDGGAGEDFMLNIPTKTVNDNKATDRSAA